MSVGQIFSFDYVSQEELQLFLKITLKKHKINYKIYENVASNFVIIIYNKQCYISNVFNKYSVIIEKLLRLNN